MKTKFVQLMSITLAALLQIAPLVRSLLPGAQGLVPSAWGIILKLGVGATALLGFDAVSSASSISISPPNATVGTPYVGTITYSGGHSGSVSSMSFSNNCMGSSIPFFDGLSIVYAGANKATVTGTPTSPTTNTFSIKVWDHAGCPGTGETDTRATTLIVQSSGGSPFAPSNPTIVNTVAQVGSDVQLSGVSSGNPIPQYQWWTALGVPIVGATNSYLNLSAVQLTNAGIYTLTASNSQTAGFSFGALPKGACYLSVAISGGTNFTTYLYTNYAPASVALTLFSYLTNGTSTSTNYYYWVYNSANTLSTSNTYQFTAAALTPSKSGTYTVYMSSTNGGGAIVSSQPYDSYWSFGYPPVFTNSLPASTNVNTGTNVTFSIAAGGSLNVYNASGGNSYSTNGGVPCVFWYQNGALVASQAYTNGPTSGTTYSNTFVNASLTLSNVSAANNGNYTVVATNYWGSITSSPVALTVSGGSSFAPVITTNTPASLALLVGQNSAISVTATGTPPLYFQWRRAGTNLANGGVYGGVLTNILTLTSVTTNNSGNYTVAITNSSGAVTSSVAAVSIALPPKLTGSLGSPGNVQFSGSTITDVTYVVEMATNLASDTWIPVQTNNTGVSGAVSFQTNTASGPNKFYRLKF